MSAWADDATVDGFSAFLRSCFTLKAKAEWQAVCADAAALPAADEATVRQFFKTSFTPYTVVNPDGTVEGTITGYYEPLLRGSRRASAQYRFPVYGVPDDLLTIDLSEVYPELKNMRLRGRLDGKRVVPYYTRADIQAGKGVNGRELVWVEDAVDLFFLQIQGSGKVALDSGEIIRVELCGPERASLPFGRTSAGRARRAHAGPGVDAGHPRVGQSQSRQAAGVAQQQRELRILSRAAGRHSGPGGRARYPAHSRAAVSRSMRA